MSVASEIRQLLRETKFAITRFEDDGDPDELIDARAMLGEILDMLEAPPLAVVPDPDTD